MSNREKMIEKPWGHEEILHKDDVYRVKKLVVNEGQRTSLQYHKKKHEVMFYPNGSFEYFKPYDKHRLEGPIEVLEVSWGGSDEDIVRLEDDYGRSQ